MNSQSTTTTSMDDSNTLLSKVLGADVEGSVGGSSLWMHMTGAIPKTTDARDKQTTDAWVPRNDKLARHPKTEPGARGGGARAEPTVELLASVGFLTPPALHFFNHRSAVPMIDANKFKLTLHIGKKKFVFNVQQLRKMEKASTTATIASAGLRGAELSARKKSQASSPFGACGLATGIWTGVPLVKLLARCGVKRCADYDANIIFRGPDKQIGIDGGTPYESSMPLAEAIDTIRNVIVAYEVNGHTLTPDLGAPLRLVVPGAVDERCVKWLTSIVVGKRGANQDKKCDPLSEPTSFFFAQRTRLYPPTARDASEAEGRRLDTIPVNSAVMVPAHGEVVRVDPYKPKKMVIRGWAYSGGGTAINGVEVSLDRGLTWQSADVEGDRSNMSGKRPERSWCWTLWMLAVDGATLVHHMIEDGEVWVRATDSNGACQPEEAPWNFLGLCNNGYYKVKASTQVMESSGTYAVKFLHPCVRELDGKCTGWMDIGMQMAEKAAAASVAAAPAPFGADITPKGSSKEPMVNNLVSTTTLTTSTTTTATAPVTTTAVTPIVSNEKEYTWDEIQEHNKDDDVWIVVNNNVYEVTKYLDQHPGGAASITMNAGEDTSEDFTAVHSAKAWKDLEQYKIGIVAGTGGGNPAAAAAAPEVNNSIAPAPERSSMMPPFVKAMESPSSTPSMTPNTSTHGGSMHGRVGGSSHGSSSSMKKSKSGMFRRIESFFKKSSEKAPSPDDKNEDAVAAANAEIGAYERMLSPFASFPVSEAPVCLNPKKWVKVKLADIHWISPDTVLVRFALTSPQHVLGLPTGQHFMIKGKDNEGKPVIRAYTPTSPNTDVGFVDLVIKVYFPCPEYPLGGKLSQFIGNLKIGDEIDIKGPIGEITYLGRGKFTIHKVGELHCKRITLIGAGTGITPLLQIAAACLRDPEDDTKLRLVFANRFEEDILCRRIIDNMAKKYPKQFECHYVLSKAPQEWVMSGKGSAGRVNLPILRQFGFSFEATGDASDPGAIGLTCGSDAFNEQAAFGNLLQMGYPRDRMFAF